MYRLFLFFFLLILGTGLRAQHTISGPFSPSADFKWVMAYELKPNSQEYVTAGPVKNGNLELIMPKTAKEGMYRMVYAIPTDEFYFDVIYNGKEDIQLAFNTEKGVSFTSSLENETYNSYRNDINATERKLIDFYASGQKGKAEFNAIIKQLKSVQDSYEKKAEGMIASNFIKANAPYIPTPQENGQQYELSKKQHFFDALHFDDPVLQGSGFLMDKAVAFVFSSGMSIAPALVEEQEVQNNLEILNGSIGQVDALYKARLFEKLWTVANLRKMGSTAALISNEYLFPIAQEEGTKEILEITEKIALENRLRIGAKAPEILWMDKGKERKLSDLSDAEHYVLLFWSSTCSHCLKEVPELHTYLKNIPSVKVLAFGLEDDDVSWKEESAKLPNFTHVLGLGKWENEYVKLFDVHQTPTYFILDSEKRIVDKPSSFVELLSFWEK